MENFFYRRATVKDCEHLSKLAHNLNLFHGMDLSPNSEKLASDWGKYDAYVVEDENKEVIGFAQGYETYQVHDASSGYEIQNLYISDRFRKKGLGKSLLHKMIKEKHDTGTEVFKLTILKSNESALLFYKSLGFEMKDGNILYFAKLKGKNLENFLKSD